MIFISPHLEIILTLPNTTPIRGSFTLNERPSKMGSNIKNFKIYTGIRWINKIGLRNPGIDYAIETYKKRRNNKYCYNG